MILKKFRLYFDLSVIGFCISGLSLLVIPFSDFDGISFEKVLPYVIATVFWLSLFVGIFFLIMTSKMCRGIEKKLKKNNNYTYKPKIGIITFFSNREAKFCDIVLFIFAALVAGLTVAGVQIEWLMVCCVSILFLFAVFHSFFNGKNYLYIKSYKKFLEQKERKENE